MLRSWERLRRFVAPGQLELTLAPRAPAPTDDAGTLLARLTALGLRGIRRCTLTRNRSTVVSFRGDALRVHRVLATAPADVLQAIVGFVNGRGAVRRAACRTLSAFEIPGPAGGAPARRRSPSSHPEDEALALRLRTAHTTLNAERFDGALGTVAIRVSRRMRSRLGHYSPGAGTEPEIAIGRRHLRRDGWASVVDTLVHEMVHQWQHETGRPVAHDADFRRKARTVGISPQAKRPAGR
jgi:SprT-like family